MRQHIPLPWCCPKLHNHLKLSTGTNHAWFNSGTRHCDVSWQPLAFLASTPCPLGRGSMKGWMGLKSSTASSWARCSCLTDLRMSQNLATPKTVLSCLIKSTCNGNPEQKSKSFYMSNDCTAEMCICIILRNFNTIMPK